MTKREKFEEFLERMPKNWTNINVLTEMSGLRKFTLVQLLQEAKSHGLVEHRKVLKENKSTTGEWRRI